MVDGYLISFLGFSFVSLDWTGLVLQDWGILVDRAHSAFWSVPSLVIKGLLGLTVLSLEFLHRPLSRASKSNSSHDSGVRTIGTVICQSSFIILRFIAGRPRGETLISRVQGRPHDGLLNLGIPGTKLRLRLAFPRRRHKKRRR